MIELTDPTGTKFWQNVFRIDTILERMGNTAELITITGEHLEVKEAARSVADRVNFLMRQIRNA